MRHAHAVPAGPGTDGGTDGVTADAHRHLSASGRRAAREVGRVLRAQGVELDAIFTSPLCRAVQTAELLAGVTDFLGTVQVLSSLAPGVPAPVAARDLLGRGACVAVVGHEPGIAGLGAQLCGRPSFPPFRPGQLACIEDGQPRFYIHPETLAVDRLLLA